MKNLESHFINIFMRTQFSRHITTSFTRNMCRSGCVISARKKTEKTIFHLRRCYSFRCGDNALSICNEEIKVIRSTDKHESDFSVAIGMCRCCAKWPNSVANILQYFTACLRHNKFLNLHFDTLHNPPPIHSSPISKCPQFFTLDAIFKNSLIGIIFCKPIEGDMNEKCHTDWNCTTLNEVIKLNNADTRGWKDGIKKH